MKHIDENILLDYFYDELEDSVKLEVNSHLESCAHCRDYLAELDALGKQFEGLENQKSDTDTFQMVMHAIEEQSVSKESKLKSIYPYVFISVGMILFIAIIFLMNGYIEELSILKPLKQFDFWQAMSSSLRAFSLVVVIGIVMGIGMSLFLIFEEEREFHENSLREI